MRRNTQGATPDARERASRPRTILTVWREDAFVVGP